MRQDKFFFSLVKKQMRCTTPPVYHFEIKYLCRGNIYVEAKLEQRYSVFLFTIYDSFVCSLHLWDHTVVTMSYFHSPVF